MQYLQTRIEYTCKTGEMDAGGVGGSGATPMQQEGCYSVRRTAALCELVTGRKTPSQL